MGVLLGLRDVQLRDVRGGEHGGERDGGALGGKGDGVGPRFVVLGEGGVLLDRLDAAAALPAGQRLGGGWAPLGGRVSKSPLGQRAGQLADAVGTEVEAEYGVPGADQALGPNRGGGDELVGLATRVGLLHGLHPRLRVVGCVTVDEQVVGGLDALPAAVAVHRVPAADNGGHAHPAVRSWRPKLVAPALHQADVLDARFRRGVTAVGEAVDDEVTDGEAPGELDESLEVPEARVDATVGDEPDQVDALGAGERVVDRNVLGQDPVEDGVIDAGEVLAHDRAGAEVEVTDLGVAHLPLGQPNGAPGGGERGVGVGGPQLVEHGGVGERDRVAGAGLGETPTIQHDEANAGHAQEAA